MNSTIQRAVAPARSAASWQDVAGGYLRLLRPANLVTSAADVLTGWVVVGAGPGESLAWRLLASISLYGGGVVLNDFFDRHLDALERPERPIPSGTIPAAHAAIVGALLLVAGVGAAFCASLIAGIVGSLIAVLVLAYNVSAKHSFLGPWVMGACRGLNLLLGLAAGAALLREFWFLALLPFAYIGGITALSRGEVSGGSRRSTSLALTLFAGTLLALLATHGSAPTPLFRMLPFVVLLSVRVGPALWRAYCRPQPAEIRMAVEAGVVSLIVLDAALASGYGGVVYGAAILALLVVAAELARLFPVT